jgi:hypothetical protein
MTGTYDALIQIPVDGQPVSVDQYGIPVRNAILDLDARVISLAGLGIPGAAVTTGSNGTATSGTTETRDAVLGNYQFTAIANVRYRLTLAGRGPSCTVVADRFALGLRYTIGGATPTSSDTLLGHTTTWVPSVAGGNGVVTVNHSASFIPGAGLITVASFWTRLNGTGVATPTGLCEMYAEAIGYV